MSVRYGPPLGGSLPSPESSMAFEVPRTRTFAGPVLLRLQATTSASAEISDGEPVRTIRHVSVAPSSLPRI